MSTDATPSWSGYIFQGEVALCKAIEKINELGDNIPNNCCLKLEADEDFSLLINNILEVFQVKAYLTNDANRISKYKNVIEELINKYYYSIDIIPDPLDGRKRTTTYSIYKRDIPIKCNLITDKTIIDYNINLTDFHSRFSCVDLEYFDLQHGIYTLENITKKTDVALKVLFPDLNDSDIELKRNFCNYKILSAIKERHRTGTVKSFPLNEIKEWILDSDIAFNEEIAWYEINKIFLEAITEGLEEYDLESPEDLSVYNKIQSFVFEVEQLEFNEIIKLIDYYLTPHKKIDKNNLRNSFANYIDQPTIRNVILRAIKEINENPSFNSLQYYINGQRNQLLIHNNEYDMNDNAEKRLFQKHCETIFNQPNSKDIDCFVTRGLSANLDEIKSRLYPIINSDLEDDYFEFININEFVNKLKQ
ncbi:ABC-three component system protein [Flavobacterium hydrophilum]|uniref:ABC-three component systems C-terminal domain-containing protein n=1 Tax=Flavobacterium hydrophilum TaxID=2211445 RepID=A0A2V4C4H2_9FLAO|nr:ABC-three component system protein [Flavobacterium hydrophilum]PXY45887.1 hypothetical protein DMB68_01465 [Flavobacterium hydrophilum]